MDFDCWIGASHGSNSLLQILHGDCSFEVGFSVPEEPVGGIEAVGSVLDGQSQYGDDVLVIPTAENYLNVKESKAPINSVYYFLCVIL